MSCRPSNRAWEAISKGDHGQSLTTFLLQARSNRMTAYSDVHRFLPSVAPSPACPHCSPELDTMAHRLFSCRLRRPLAQALRTELAYRLANGSSYPWPTFPPPDLPNLKALLSAFWPNSIMNIVPIKFSRLYYFLSFCFSII